LPGRDGDPGWGSRGAFDTDWHEALETRDRRWLAYPAEKPITQVELFELVKAKRIEQLLAAYGIRSGRVVEYGCGSAGMSVYLANRGFESHAIDVSAKALLVARLNTQLHHAGGRPTLVRSDAFRMPYSDGMFDVAMSHGLLEHFESAQLPALIEEVLRVLRPGGLFVADVVPGIGRLTSRTVGQLANYLASALYYLAIGRLARARGLRAEYFGHLYENTMSDKQWASVLEESGIRSVEVEVCRPFPPLALSGKLEQVYLGLMIRALPLWRRFDGSNTWWSRRWGWMYLVHGVRP